MQEPPTPKKAKKAEFSVHVPDLEDGPRTIERAAPSAWLDELLADTEVRAAGGEDGRVRLFVEKVGRDVIVRGHLDVKISVPCSRTLDPAFYELRPEVFLLLTPSSKPEPRRGPKKARASAASETSRESAKEDRAGWSADPALTDDEAALDTYSGDDIHLDDFLREFILLEVPMVPVREDLRDAPFEATPPLPRAPGDGQSSPEQTIDPRLIALIELKARLEKKE